MTKAVRRLEQAIAVAVVVVLTLGVILVLRSVAVHLWEGFRYGLDGHALTNLLSEALLTLMIAEIIASVASLFESRELDARPLLVIAIIASIRRLLVISAEAADFVASGVTIPVTMLVELGILTVGVGIFAWSVRQVERSRGVVLGATPSPAHDG